ncbi:porin [Opitutus sp. ER46]|uniref:OprO/OprP family phosphate-selective porin n=1 Tax=Opitutus sp. ER46 TaxID=2161864 RepID=UPI0011B2512F|nr:porin [Opitutus sp. ER46]
MHKSIQLARVLALAAASTLPLAAASEADDVRVLREQVAALQQQLTALTQRIEAKEQAPALAAPKINLTDKGFSFSSADAANLIRFRGVAQFDSRVFLNDEGITNNSFLLRRARIITDGTFAKNYSFVFVPEFGGGSVSILDAAVGIAIDPALQLKFGKFTPPLGLERLQGVCWNFLNEASLASNLVPVRDVGAQASGALAKGVVNYAVGVFNGVADNAASSNSDFDNDKEVMARVMVSPFKNAEQSALRGLTAGVAASYGRSKTASGRAAAYKTDGQQTFFSYNSSVVADGAAWRLVPQLDYRSGPLGVMSEYVVSTVNLRPGAGAPKVQLANRAWQLAAGYVLTGEASSYTGLTPRSNFDLAAGTWGAFEVVGRCSGFQVDDDAFPLLASAAASANEATSYAAGLNWYLSKTVLFSTDCYLTHFGFNAAAPATATNAVLRQDEKALIMRVQIAF